MGPTWRPYLIFDSLSCEDDPRVSVLIGQLLYPMDFLCGPSLSLSSIVIFFFSIRFCLLKTFCGFCYFFLFG